MAAPRRTLVILLAAAASVRLGAFWAFRPLFDFVSTGAAHESGPVDTYASNLITTGVYGLTPGVPDAVLPPLYSATLAAVYRIGGRGAWQAVMLNSALDLVTLLAVYAIGRRLFDRGPAVGLLAAAFTAFYPYLVFQSLTLADTSLFTALLYVVVLLVMELRRATDRKTVLGVGIAAGVVAGLATLTRPMFPPFALLVGCWLALTLGWRDALRRLVPMSVAAALVVAPWVARNSVLFGQFVAVSTNGGSNFWAGNNHQTVEFLRAGYDVQWIPGPALRTEADRFGPVADAEFLHLGLAYLREHPREIPALIWTKLRVQWSIDVAPRLNPSVGGIGPTGTVVASARGGQLRVEGLAAESPIASYSTPLFDRLGRTIHRLYWGTLFLAGCVGLGLTAARWREVSILWAVPTALTAAYVLTHPSTRYRAPGDPAWFLFAAAALVRLIPGSSIATALAAHQSSPALRGACCWMSTARYGRPLNPTEARKWRTLSRLGAPLHVVGFSDGAWPRRFTEHATFHLMPRLPFAWLRRLTLLVASPIVLLCVTVRHDVRVIVAQGPLEGMGAAVVKLVLKLCGRRIRLVVESHGDFERSSVLYRRLPFPGLVQALMRHAAAFALRHADAGRAVSTATGLQLAQAAGRDLPIVTFPTWIDVQAFSSFARRASPSASNEVLFVGGLAPVKGVHVLLEAFARARQVVPAARLIVAGPVVNAAYAAGLRTRTARLGVQSSVSFVGPQTSEKLAELMGRARLLAVPSLSEGLPRVAIEAMLVGTPVIASRVGGLPDLIRPGDTGYLVAPDDVEALAAGLRHAFDDPDIDALGERARAAARQMLPPDLFLDAHRRLLAAAGVNFVASTAS
jgi:glycosyltransferase involved in cell wall biosynthesis/4-amino-4-deoxy-L-arabinose transferase-like glycosyltransferase